MDLGTRRSKDRFVCDGKPALQGTKKPVQSCSSDRHWLGKFAAYAAAIAAIASAIAAGVTLHFAHTESERYGRLHSIREIKDFERSIAELRFPRECMRFLNAISDDDHLRSLLFGEPQSIVLPLTDTQRNNLSVCLSGFDMVPSEDTSEVDASEPRARVFQSWVEPQAIRAIRRFLFKYLNVHDELAMFHISGFADPGLMNNYVIRHVYRDEGIAHLFDAICRRLGKSMYNHYRPTIDGINSVRKDKVCQPNSARTASGRRLVRGRLE